MLLVQPKMKLWLGQPFQHTCAQERSLETPNTCHRAQLGLSRAQVQGN